MTFKIYWLEYHNPFNWGETEEEGIKNICNSLPVKSWAYDVNENDGWIEVECEDTFEANSIKKAKKKVMDEYDIPSGVFTVFDENDERVFTEEDLETTYSYSKEEAK